MSRTNRDRAAPLFTVAMAIGIHSTIIAWLPATIVPKKKISAKTKKVGIGRAEKNSGSSSMTPVAARTSLKIITSQVLTRSLASKAVLKNGTSSLGLKRFTKTLMIIHISTASSTGSLKMRMIRMASAILQALCASSFQ